MANYTTTGSDTFPSGHVIQHKYNQYNPGDHVYLDSGTSWVAHGNNDSLKFNFTPKSAVSTLIIEYTSGIGHSSSGGGYGFLAFTKDGTSGSNRNDWGGTASTSYSDTYGHFGVGINDQAGLYIGFIGRLIVPSASHTSQFELGVAVRRAAGSWFYIHVGSRQQLSITEIII